MSSGHGGPQPFQSWEKLFKEVLFESDEFKMPRRIELAKHAILDRLEDGMCARHRAHLSDGELSALRDANRTLRALEKIYMPAKSDKKIA